MIVPKNYEETVRLVQCLQLKKNSHNVDDDLVEKIFHFLGMSPACSVVMAGGMLSFYQGETVVSTQSGFSNLGTIRVTARDCSITLPPPQYSGGFFGDGGSSGNNNNNNNNNG